MRRIPLVIVVLGLLLPTALYSAKSKGNEKPVWLVITRPMFLKTLQPLVERRREDGFDPVVSVSPVEDAIADLKREPSFILLVGDDMSGNEKEPWYVPCKRIKAYKWWPYQRDEYASDTIYGDMDGDSVPDVPVGRIPVRTAEQLKLVVGKIINFETRRPKLDDLRMPVWTGSPSYNMMIDSMAVGLLLKTVKASAPLWAEMWLMAGDAKHPLCGWPFEQGAIFTKQLKRGGVVTVLMGHGMEDYFHSMRVKFIQVRYTAREAGKVLDTGQAGPPLIIFACHCGNFIWSKDSLSESLFLMPAGPVATISATAISHPLTNYYSGRRFLSELGRGEKRIGTLWLESLQKAMKHRDILLEGILLTVDSQLNNKGHVEKLKRDHDLMYSLLGDPATKLHVPDRLAAEIERQENEWHWKAVKPEGAEKLYVGLRKPWKEMPRRKVRLERNSAARELIEANSAFTFEELAELSADSAWEGVVDREGTLRLVAIGPGCFSTYSFDLKLPEKQKDSLDMKDQIIRVHDPEGS